MFVPFVTGDNSNNQKAELSNRIKDVFSKIESGDTFDNISNKSLLRHPKLSLDMLSRYTEHHNSKVREYAYTYIWQVGYNSDNRNIRNNATSLLVNAIENSDKFVRKNLFNRLVTFDVNDFTQPSINMVQSLVEKIELSPEFIRVFGILELHNEAMWLESLLIDEKNHTGKWYGKIAWSARLARARMGILDDIKQAINLVDEEQDHVVRVTLLLDDLIYTRQSEAILYVAGYLDSELRLPRIKENVPGTPYAQYAMDILVRHLPDCPVKRNGSYNFNYSKEEIRQISDWLKNK